MQSATPFALVAAALANFLAFAFAEDATLVTNLTPFPMRLPVGFKTFLYPNLTAPNAASFTPLAALFTAIRNSSPM